VVLFIFFQGAALKAGIPSYTLAGKLVENLNSDIKNNVVSETDWIDKLYGSL